MICRRSKQLNSPTGIFIYSHASLAGHGFREMVTMGSSTMQTLTEKLLMMSLRDRTLWDHITSEPHFWPKHNCVALDYAALLANSFHGKPS